MATLRAITLPNTWQDECEDFQVIPRKDEISEINMKHAQQVRSWFI